MSYFLSFSSYFKNVDGEKKKIQTQTKQLMIKTLLAIQTIH